MPIFKFCVVNKLIENDLVSFFNILSTFIGINSLFDKF